MSKKNKAEVDIGSWLNELPEGDRQALWQRFATARNSLKSTELDQAWKSQCTGPGSTENKHKLLGVFLKENGKLKNSQAYLNEIGKLCKESGHSVTEEWVPFETMKVAYGLNELCRRLKKGTVIARPAEDDPEEFEFRKVTKTTFTSEKHTQEIQAHFSGKADLEAWMRMKGHFMKDYGSASSNNSAQQALELNLDPKDKKKRGTPKSTFLASDDSSEAEQEATDPDVFKADEISNKAGQDKGKNAMERINNMHRLMTKVMKESNGKSKKVLIAPMQLFGPSQSQQEGSQTVQEVARLSLPSFIDRLSLLSVLTCRLACISLLKHAVNLWSSASHRQQEQRIFLQLSL